MDDSKEFEIKIFPEWKEAFFKEIEEPDQAALLSYFRNLILELKYSEVISAIISLQKLPLLSPTMEAIKLEWWCEYLKENMFKTDDGRIELYDFKGTLSNFESIDDVYFRFIHPQNEIIWTPYYNVFTKIFVIWCTETIIKGLKDVPIEKRIDFINKSTLKIQKEQALEEYIKNELNEHLIYYRKILQSVLAEVIKDREIYENEKVFSSLTENEKLPNLLQFLFKQDLEGFFKTIKIIYASIPYILFSTEESYFHSIFHVILILIASSVKSEEPTNLGRIDTCVELDKYIYIFEFKVTNAITALKQIHEKKYYEKYLLTNKKIFLVGVSFDYKIKNIKEWIVEEYTSSWTSFPL